MQQENQLFEFKQPDSPPLLLILDRRNDPITPLLNQWTYQAMIHELVGIKNNLVSSPEIAAANKDFKVFFVVFFFFSFFLFFSSFFFFSFFSFFFTERESSFRKSFCPQIRTLSSRRTCS